MQENASFHVVGHGSRQRQTLDIAPLGHQILRVVGMAYRVHPLGDDRPFIEVVVDIVGSGPDQLDALFIGLMVGLGPLETGQEPGRND